jgi:hypothetical protein
LNNFYIRNRLRKIFTELEKRTIIKFLFYRNFYKEVKKLILFFEENKEKIYEIGRYYYTSFSKLCNEIVHAYKNEIN